jgi:hypothetical protein
MLLSAAAVGVPLAMLAAVSITNYRDIEQAQFDAARHTAEALSEHALRTFRAQELMVDVAAQLVEGQPWPQLHKSAALSARLARLVSAEPDIGSIVITSPDGRETISNKAPFATRAWRSATISPPCATGRSSGCSSASPPSGL